jgi:hypothetical protein
VEFSPRGNTSELPWWKKELPTEIGRVVDKMIDTDPQRRYASIKEAYEAFSGAATSVVI